VAQRQDWPDLTSDLRNRAPKLRGKLEANAPLGPLSYFKTGGPAQALYEPADETDLAYFLELLDPTIPVLVLGLGSNILVRDGGIAGVVIRLGKPFQEITVEGLQITAGAGAPLVKLATAAASAGIAGLAFTRGIPGAVGGALRMNAGAYGSETRRILVSCRGIDRRGHMLAFLNSDMAYSYRHCGIANDVIFTQATFVGTAGETQSILTEMAEITKARAETQPVSTRTGGSTFKNPPGVKAWELIDRAGCRGLVVGDAQVSKLHCNFLVNRGNATAADLESLGESVRTRVRETSGIELEWEILRVGVAVRGLA
jgi:UDP-N-acetylmuramate dehydrogenase